MEHPVICLKSDQVCLETVLLSCFPHTTEKSNDHDRPGTWLLLFRAATSSSAQNGAERCNVQPQTLAISPPFGATKKFSATLVSLLIMLTDHNVSRVYSAMPLAESLLRGYMCSRANLKKCQNQTWLGLCLMKYQWNGFNVFPLLRHVSNFSSFRDFSAYSTFITGDRVFKNEACIYLAVPKIH